MDPSFWRGKKVLVTGGNGFLGKELIPKLTKLGAQAFAPRSNSFDLRREADVKRMFDEFKPEIVIHMAVNGGGIGYMKEHPAKTCYDNVLMNTHVVHCAMEARVTKFVGIGSVCEYPKFAPVPFREEDLWNGYPEETNAPYGLSKRMLLVQSQAYNKEYGMNALHLLLVNLYGPHDNFGIRSHVIPALIERMFKAKLKDEKTVTLWGTGNVSREFIYTEDASEAILLASERYNKPYPVNVGSGEEITIKELSNVIAKLVGYEGEIAWDTTKPDGQPRRKLDVSKAKAEFGFEAKTRLRDGLRKAVQWYENEVLRH